MFYIYEKKEPDKAINLLNDLAASNNVFTKTAAEELRFLGFSVSKPLKPSIISKNVDAILECNHPNPFNPETKISFLLKKAGKVKVTIYNILGQKIKILVDDYRREGIHRITWDSKNDYGIKVSSGVYFYQLIFENKVIDTKKMLMLK